MAKSYEKIVSTMREDVAANRRGTNARDKWDVDEDGNVIDKTHANYEYPQLEITKGDDGSLSCAIPQLAIGSAGRPRVSKDLWQDRDPWNTYYTDTNSDLGKDTIRQAIYWWKKDPLVFRCIRLLVQLSNTRITFSSDNETARNTVQLWFEQAMPFSFRKQWFLEYFRSSMVPVIKTLIPYEPRDYKPNKIPSTENGLIVDRFHAKASKAPSEEQIQATQSVLEENRRNEAAYREALRVYENAKANQYTDIAPNPRRLQMLADDVSHKQYKWLRGQVPGKYSILNPMSIDIEGPPEMTWLREPYLQIGGELAGAIQNPNGAQANIVAKLPAEIVAQVRAGRLKIWLSPNIFSLTFGEKQDYERYPTPMCSHAFAALRMKKSIQDMDQATVDGITSRILLVKVGSDQYPITDNTRLKDVADIFHNIGRTGTFFWTHAIEMEFIEPKSDSLKDDKKYNHWNNEIRSAFGISQVLTGTSETSGAIGNSLMNFKSVEEETGESQDAFCEFAMAEIKNLRAALSISADVTIEFDRLNLKDETKYMAVLMQMVMNGILDHETVIESLSFHFPQIKRRMEKMTQLKKKGLFMPVPSANNMGPDGKPVPPSTGPAGKKKAKNGGQSKPGGKGGVSTGGKPANSPGADNNANKKGTSQPKKVKVSARLRHAGDGNIAMIIDTDVDNEKLQQISKTFNHPIEWIMTAATFKEKFPELTDIEPWPMLDMQEGIAATMGGTKILKDTEVRYEKALSEWKEKNAEPGKRGPYATKEVLHDLRIVARIEAEGDYLKQHTGFMSVPTEFNRAWDQHFEEAKKVVASSVSADEVDSFAWAIVTARLKKLAK